MKAARERIAASWGTLEPVDARRCRLLVGANSLGFLALWLGSLEFEMEEPAQLERQLLSLSQRLQRAAARSS